MKKFTWLCAFFLLLTACQDEACKGIECGKHGLCDAGVCECEQGYELDGQGRCDVRTATRLAGVYQASSQGCNIGTYSVTLQASQIDDPILLLVNLGSYSCSNGEKIVVEAELLDATSFRLIEGPYCEKYTFSGTGTINGDQISIDYIAEYTDSGNQIKDQCTVSLSP